MSGGGLANHNKTFITKIVKKICICAKWWKKIYIVFIRNIANWNTSGCLKSNSWVQLWLQAACNYLVFFGFSGHLRSSSSFFSSNFRLCLQFAALNIFIYFDTRRVRIPLRLFYKTIQLCTFQEKGYAIFQRLLYYSVLKHSFSLFQRLRFE